MKNIRKKIRGIMPPISQTEQEALDAGSTWLETSIFQGNPNYDALLEIPKAQLSPDEEAFISGPLKTLISMIDDVAIQDDVHIPQEIMDFLRKERFFSLIIPKSFGGLEFSPYANSTIVGKLATVSPAVAVTVMVPNSLGPGELLMHYGTTEQQNYWLPRLSEGKEIPCFALTSPEAGSDAGAIPDFGIVTKKEIDGEEVLGMEVTWEKRYITLAPIATVLGLAFKVYDPNGLLGDEENLGITCALIPGDHEGVELGGRHDPMGVRFYNGTTRGEKVFIPMDFIIGGQGNIGKGWQMLVACLGAGRGISLPAMGTASSQMSLKSTSLYAFVREQFNTPIGKFEGIEEKLAKIAGNTYAVEAMRVLTTEGLGLGLKPSVVTAMTKYHMTEIGREVINDAMDIQAGKAIQQGHKNVLATSYKSQPVGITVEGANILTRNLMIFGQGVMRCHPYLQDLVESIYDESEGADKRFLGLVGSTIGYSVKNAFRSLVRSYTPKFIGAPALVVTYKKEIDELSANLATMADMSLLVLGGNLKKAELLSARLGDMMSYLYMAMAITRYRAIHVGLTNETDYYYEHAIRDVLYKARVAKADFIDNFPNVFMRTKLRVLTGTFKQPEKMIDDKLTRNLSNESLSTDSEVFKMITGLVEKAENSAFHDLEEAYRLKSQLVALGVLKKVRKAMKGASISEFLSFEDKLSELVAKGALTDSEKVMLLEYDEVRQRVIAVDEYDNDLNAL